MTTTGRFVTLDIDGNILPGDWYLRLSGEGTKMLRGEIDMTSVIPIVPFPDNAAFISQEVPTVMGPGTTRSVSLIFENRRITNWTAADSYSLVYAVTSRQGYWL